MTAFASFALTLAHPGVFLPAVYADEKGETCILREVQFGDFVTERSGEK